LPAAELLPRLHAAKETIESVCDLERLPKVNVETKELPTREIDGVALYTDGQYVRQAEPDALANVYIDPRGPGPEFALAHETGHHIDDQAFGAIDPETGIWLLGSSAYKKGLLQKDVQEAYEQLFDAIHSSQTYRYLKGSLAQAIDNEYNDMIKYTQYLLMDEELLARSYAQYVTIRSGNDILARQLEDALIPRYNVTKMWYAQDFDKIANAFEHLFRIAGMRQ
jgi:hypothetical protein